MNLWRKQGTSAVRACARLCSCMHTSTSASSPSILNLHQFDGTRDPMCRLHVTTWSREQRSREPPPRWERGRPRRKQFLKFAPDTCFRFKRKAFSEGAVGDEMLAGVRIDVIASEKCRILQSVLYHIHNYFRVVGLLWPRVADPSERLHPISENRQGSFSRLVCKIDDLAVSQVNPDVVGRSGLPVYSGLPLHSGLPVYSGLLVCCHSVAGLDNTKMKPKAMFTNRTIWAITHQRKFKAKVKTDKHKVV